MKMKTSLKNKLLIAFFLFTVVPLIILGSYSYFKSSNALQNATETELRTQGTSAATSINKTITSASSYIQLLSLDSRLPVVASGDSSNSQDVYNYLSTIQKQHSNEIEMLAISDAQGKEILNNITGKVNIDVSSREYIQKALSGTPSQSDVTVSKTTGKTVVFVAYPLKVNDKIVGTVIASIYSKNIYNDVSKIKNGSNGSAYMINSAGLIVYHPDSKKEFKTNIADINNSDLNTLFSKAKSGKAVSGSYTLNGVRKFVVITPTNNWFLVLTADYTEYMSSALLIRTITIIIIIICTLLSILIAYFGIANKIVTPIKSLEVLMTKAGDGDFTVHAEIRTKDELQTLGEYFNKMIKGQEHIIKNIRNFSEDLSASSEEISASSEEISSATEEIAAQVQQIADNSDRQNGLIVDTSEVLIELSSLVQIAQNKASTAKVNSDSTLKVAHAGRDEVEKTVAAINNISTSSDETKKVLDVLADLSIKISGITKTINDISEQTNLLALNAAIEAARAGEHGKGFTVVAEEVRNLSEQTSNGAQEISTLINKMTTLTKKAVDSMSSSKVAVEKGVLVANNTDKSFVNIISAIDQIATDINQIVDVTKNEVASSEEIVKLIDSVATMSEKNSSSSQQVAAATEEQASTIQNIATSSQQSAETAMDMNNLIEKYKI